MGGTNTTPNVTLDFTQAQNVNQPAAAASQGQPSQSGVTLDFSKAEPTVVSMRGPQGEIQQVPVENVTAMRQKNYAVTSDNPGVTKMSSPEGKTTYALPSEVDQFKASGHVVNGYSERLNNGKLEYTYTSGQKAIDAQHPETSVDDQGNVYYKGAPLKPTDTTGLVPTPGLGAVAEKGLAKLGETEAMQLFKSSPRLYAEYQLKNIGSTAANLARSPVTKAIVGKSLDRAVDAGLLGALYWLTRNK